MYGQQRRNTVVKMKYNSIIELMVFKRDAWLYFDKLMAISQYLNAQKTNFWNGRSTFHFRVSCPNFFFLATFEFPVDHL